MDHLQKSIFSLSVILFVVCLFASSMTRYHESFVNSVGAWGTDAAVISTAAMPAGASAEIAFPSKCFDCEKQYPPGERWRAQPTKCFDCEDSSPASQYTHPNKCFDCEF